MSAARHADTSSIREAAPEDLPGVLALYRRVARIPGGLARLEHEIDEAYVRQFLTKASAEGLALVAVDTNGAIRAEMHAYPPGPFCFSHVYSDLTIAVDPECQGSGLGRRLFESFMQRVIAARTHVMRVELIARESNVRALGFYESLGFVTEGRMRARIRNLDDTLEADVPMAWLRDAAAPPTAR